MKKIISTAVATVAIVIASANSHCLSNETASTDVPVSEASNSNAPNETSFDPSPRAELREIDMPGGKKAYVAIKPDVATTYIKDVPAKDCYLEISKRSLRLYVKAKINGQERIVAHYPICCGLRFGDKHEEGDMKTPECAKGQYYTITEIRDASNWKHDFGDGRGNIKSYGDWFLRLKTGHKGIGIHGSTNNEQTVPGRASEGCIRLRDADIKDLKTKYAWVGMKVVILGDGE